ncbi:MAG TPA: signal peptidase I [Bacilli bacterium]|nr:signal peptidase I [Bacilli bacterium]
MKKGLHIAGQVATGLLVVLLLFNLYFVISSKINGGEPKVMGHELMVVLSGSMNPVFKTGDLIAVKPGDVNTAYQVGDVITFRSPEDANKIITHRVTEVTERNGMRLYVTQGDANDSKDPKPVPQLNVIGQYADFHIPKLGYALSFIKSKPGMAIMLIVPGVLLIFGPMVNLFRELLKKEPTEGEAETAATQETDEAAVDEEEASDTSTT